MTNFKINLDKSVRPQDDLYRHVNNKWLNSTQIPPERGIWGSFYELREQAVNDLHQIAKGLTGKASAHNAVEQKVRDFYLSGMNLKNAQIQGYAKLRSLFERADALINKGKVAQLLGELHLMDVKAFFSFYIDIDEKNSSRHILRIAQSGISLPDRDYYLLKDEKMRKIQTAYKSHIPYIAKKVAPRLSYQVSTDIIWNLEKKLARSSMTATQRRDIKAQYNKMGLSGLKKIASGFDWDAYFKAIGISPPKDLIVDQPKFLTVAVHSVAQLKKSSLSQYIKWHILNTALGKLDEDIAKAHFNFYGKQLMGAKKLLPRWKRVVGVIDDCIGEALGKLYIERHFPEASKKKMEALVDYLKQAFEQRIRRIDWLSPKTRSYALRKLRKIRVKVGHARKLESYKSLDIQPDSYLENFYNSKIFESKQELKKLNKPIDPDEWEMTPPTVNAYFSPNRSEIVFPAGILQPPFFNPHANDAINYGAIGAVIGHELTHGFDDQGSQYDASGNLKNWWSKEDKGRFRKRAHLMVEQANAHEVLPGQKLKGELTLGENIADVGGAEIALEAFRLSKKRIKPNQDSGSVEEFFYSLALVERSKARPELARQLALADPHSPGVFRVNNTVRNMGAFHETFGSRPGDKMYLPPAKRMKIW